MSKKENKNFSYQRSLERLDEILADIQNGAVPLDKYEDLLKEAHEIIQTSRSYLRKLDDTIKSYEKDE